MTTAVSNAVMGMVRITPTLHATLLMISTDRYAELSSWWKDSPMV